MAATNRNSAQRAQGAKQREMVLDLRRSGLSYSRIGEKLGITKQAAHRYVEKAMEETRAQIAASADVLRAEEVARLDAMLQGLWAKAKRGDAAAVDRVLRIGERRQKLLGLEAPVRIETTGRDGKPIEVSSSVTIDPSRLSLQTLRELLDARTQPHGG